MSRLLHELTNSLSVLAGHVQLLEASKNDPARLADSLRSIQWASDSIGEAVERYADFRRHLPHARTPCGWADLLAALRLGPSDDPTLSAQTLKHWPIAVADDAPFRLGLEPRWLRYAVWEVVRLSRAAQGHIEVHAPGSSFDTRGLKTGMTRPAKTGNVYLLVRWRSAQPSLTEQALFKPPTLELALAVGTIRWAEGQVSYGFVPPEENRFWFALPVSGRA